MDLNVYAAATPAVLAVVSAEAAWCLYKRNGFYRFDDAMANFATAIGHQVTNVAAAGAAFGLFSSLHARWGLARWGQTPQSFAALYVAIDFLFYWFHRLGHARNLLWAAHAPHHSSPELNYSVGLRASVTQRLASFLFYWPLALVAEPEVVLPLIGLHLLLQLLPHTRVVRRLPGWLEAWLNCPAHHRVHHAINPEYRDRNFGGTFIVWDRLFGTFAAEAAEPVYGTLRPVGSFGPVAINVQYWRLLWDDACAAPRWTDKLRLWVMPTGWRPPGVPPRPAPPDAFGRAPLRSPLGAGARGALLLQLPVLLGAMLLVTRPESPLAPWAKAGLGAGIWLALIGWGRALDKGCAGPGRAWAGLT